jgi:hypothetical protein
LTQVKHTALTKPEAEKTGKAFSGDALAYSSTAAHHRAELNEPLVTVHEKYANDMEYVASILGLTVYPGWERKGDQRGPSCTA